MGKVIRPQAGCQENRGIPERAPFAREDMPRKSLDCMTGVRLRCDLGSEEEGHGIFVSFLLASLVRFLAERKCF